MSAFKSINVNRALLETEQRQERLRSLKAAPSGVARGEAPPPQSGRLDLGSVEAASRAVLQTFMEDAGSETLLDLTAPDRPEQVPDMGLRSTCATADLAASTVSFQQTAAAIPVFGGRVTVDVDDSEHSFLAINGQLASRPQLSPVADLSPREAAARLAHFLGAEVREDWFATAPTLMWYQDEDERAWHLTYRFHAIPASPPVPEDDEYDGPAGVGCLHGGLPPAEERFDYLVDANDGQVCYFYSVRPGLSIPVPFTANDCRNVPRQFFCENRQNTLVLSDPIRNIETYDYNGGDLSLSPPPQFPTSPVATPPSPAAVSAHYHARVVFDFFNDVLKRNGVDDKGMKLVSVVNVTNSKGNPSHPNWRNAVWYQGRMWYGADSLIPNGPPMSLAMHLDVIAHELTHGVTENTSGLVYRDLPGALNESFSDVFGIMVANWLPGAPQPVSTWTWEIGPGLGANGGPIRDMSNPARAGQPDHMSQYVRLPHHRDHGGVHIYSGIHNKAVHNLLTATEADGSSSFPVQEAALLLYLTLVRLTPTSDFLAARRTLENVTSLFYATNPARQQVRLAAIAAAYGAVGIQ